MTLGSRRDTRVALGDDGTNVPLQVTANGDLRVRDDDAAANWTAISGPGAPTISSYGSVVVDVADGAKDTLVLSPGAGKQVWVYGFYAQSDTADGTLKIVSHHDKTGAMPAADNGTISLPISGNFNMPWIKGDTDHTIQVIADGGAFIGVMTYGIAASSEAVPTATITPTASRTPTPTPTPTPTATP